jgi:hypothetical protein
LLSSRLKSGPLSKGKAVQTVLASENGTTAKRTGLLTIVRDSMRRDTAWCISNPLKYDSSTDTDAAQQIDYYSWLHNAGIALSSLSKGERSPVCVDLLELADSVLRR